MFLAAFLLGLACGAAVTACQADDAVLLLQQEVHAQGGPALARGSSVGLVPIFGGAAVRSASNDDDTISALEQVSSEFDQFTISVDLEKQAAEKKESTKERKKEKHPSLDRESLDTISVNCIMTFDIASRQIILSTGVGDMLVNPAGVVHNGKNIGKSPPNSLICMANETKAAAGAMAFFLQTTDTDYLFKTEGNWDRFVNQLCYAKKHQKNLFLWIGEVSPEIKGMLDHRDADAMPCGESQTPSNHYLRPLALLSILNKYHDLSLIAMMDLDVFFTADHFDEDVETLFFEDSQADIFAGAPSYTVLVNAAILGFKNNEFSRSFLANWFKHRCGFKDQHSLWYNLFRVFGEDKASFKWEPDKMQTYAAAAKYVPQLMGDQFPEFKAYAKSGLLQEVIHLPHLVLYPNAGNNSMRYGSNSYMAHSKRSSELLEKSWRSDQRTC